MDFRKAEERYKGRRRRRRKKKDFSKVIATRAIGGWRSNGQKKKRKK